MNPLFGIYEKPLKQMFVINPYRFGVGGPNVWYDVVGIPPTGTTNLSATDVWWGQVTVASAGTATKLRLYVRTTAADAVFKIALYTAGGTYIIGAESALITSRTPEAYVEVAITPTVVSAANYNIAFMRGAVAIGIGSNSASSIMKVDTDESSYAGFPAASLPTPNFTGQQSKPCGVYVD